MDWTAHYSPSIAFNDVLSLEILFKVILRKPFAFMPLKVFQVISVNIMLIKTIHVFIIYSKYH